MKARYGLYLALGLLAGCAGYRGGWQSVAALPGQAASREAKPFELPGLTLEARLDNRLQTRDTQVMLFVVPVSVDPRRQYIDNHRPGRTRAYVTVVAHEDGFVFRPQRARLRFDGRTFTGAVGYTFGRGEQGQWEHRPISGELALAAGQRYYLSIDFETPVPSPQQTDIVLELQDALDSPRQPPVPMLRFVPQAWEGGYT